MFYSESRKSLSPGGDVKYIVSSNCGQSWGPPVTIYTHEADGEVPKVGRWHGRGGVKGQMVSGWMEAQAAAPPPFAGDRQQAHRRQRRHLVPGRWARRVHRPAATGRASASA